MKFMIIKGVSLGCIIGLMFACNTKKDESAAMMTADKEQIKKDIQAKEDSFAMLYNTGELRDIGYMQMMQLIFIKTGRR